MRVFLRKAFATTTLTTMIGLLAGVSADAQQDKGPVEYWWVNKTAGGHYVKPNRPIWHLADLKKTHAGQSNWTQQVVLDPEMDAVYHSAAPGSKIMTSLHPDTPTVYIVVAGEVRFTVEGQDPVTATRGSIINILPKTLFSYEVTGSDNALFVEVNPRNFKTIWPATGPKPAPAPGATLTKVGFPHKAPPYTGVNRLMFNVLTDGIDKCGPAGVVVADEHLYVSWPHGYADPSEDKCGPQHPGEAPPARAPAGQKFNPHSVFGHIHAGPAEWWVLPIGATSGKFENVPEVHGVEGDVLYAPPMGWHQMTPEAPHGPSIRIAIAAYYLYGLENTENDSR